MEHLKPPCVGKNIQKLRKQQQITLSVLAERSGVSKAMLSQIESEKVNPTIATIWKIARGLEVDLDTLLKGDSEKAKKFLVIRDGDATTLDTSEEGPHLKVLSPIAMAEDLEVYILTFEPGTKLDSTPHAGGTEEYLTIIEGEIYVEAGNKNVTLHKGDFIIYNCDVNHLIENKSQQRAIVHMIVRFPKKTWGQ